MFGVVPLVLAFFLSCVAEEIVSSFKKKDAVACHELTQVSCFSDFCSCEGGGGKNIINFLRFCRAEFIREVVSQIYLVVL